MSAAAWPVELRLKRAEKVLEIDYDDGASFRLPAELLRVESPSAEVKGHGTGQKVTVPGKRQVGLVAAEPVGRYAVRLVFDDGHDTGIYSWSYLRELGETGDQLMAAYVAELAKRGLSRD
jgi:DUF971 family protein